MITQVSREKRALLFPAKSDKFVLFLTGFPKYPASNAFIDYLNELDYNVLCPIYSGTFDSYGDFSIDQCIKDAKIWYDYILRGNFFLGSQKPSLPIKSSKIVLFSQSFGSYIGDLALRQYNLTYITQSIFLSPLYRPHKHQSYESKDNAKTTAKMVSRNYPLSYRFSDKISFFKELSGEKNNQLTDKKIQGDLPVLIISGEDDKITLPIMAENQSKDYPKSELKIINGGHSSAIAIDQARELIKKFLTD